MTKGAFFFFLQVYVRGVHLFFLLTLSFPYSAAQEHGAWHDLPLRQSWGKAQSSLRAWTLGGQRTCVPEAPPLTEGGHAQGAVISPLLSSDGVGPGGRWGSSLNVRHYAGSPHGRYSI